MNILGKGEFELNIYDDLEKTFNLPPKIYLQRHYWRFKECDQIGCYSFEDLLTEWYSDPSDRVEIESCAYLGWRKGPFGYQVLTMEELYKYFVSYDTYNSKYTMKEFVTAINTCIKHDKRKLRMFPSKNVMRAGHVIISIYNDRDRGIDYYDGTNGCMTDEEWSHKLETEEKMPDEKMPDE